MSLTASELIRDLAAAMADEGGDLEIVVEGKYGTIAGLAQRTKIIQDEDGNAVFKIECGVEIDATLLEDY